LPPKAGSAHEARLSKALWRENLTSDLAGGTFRLTSTGHERYVLAAARSASESRLH